MNKNVLGAFVTLQVFLYTCLTLFLFYNKDFNDKKPLRSQNLLANILKLWPKNQLSVKIIPKGLSSWVLSSLTSNLVCSSAEDALFHVSKELVLYAISLVLSQMKQVSFLFFFLNPLLPLQTLIKKDLPEFSGVLLVIGRKNNSKNPNVCDV